MPDKPPDTLFADCRDGNHTECLFQWPDPESPDVLITCACECHAKER